MCIMVVISKKKKLPNHNSLQKVVKNKNRKKMQIKRKAKLLKEKMKKGKSQLSSPMKT